MSRHQHQWVETTERSNKFYRYCCASCPARAVGGIFEFEAGVGYKPDSNPPSIDGDYPDHWPTIPTETVEGAALKASFMAGEPQPDALPSNLQILPQGMTFTKEPGLTVIPIHAPVTVGAVEGTVLRIEIEPGFVRYMVGYWDGKVYRETWFDDALVTSSTPRQRIGFK